MKPAPFEYREPQDLRQALSWLRELAQGEGRDAKLLAGGQSLMPMMNMRLARPEVVIDLNPLEGALSGVRREGDWLWVGAMTRHYRLEDDPLVRELCPMMAEAERLIGHPQIRSRGTIGGSLVHADPSAELPLVVTTLGGRLRLQSLEQEREVGPEEFFLTYLTTAVAADEILVEVGVPVMPPRSGQAIEEFAMRHGDFAIVAAAAQVTLDEGDRLKAVRLGLGGVGPTPVAVAEVLAEQLGQPVEGQRLRQALAAVGEHIQPDSDLHASAEYRRDLAVTMSYRAVRQACLRAGVRASAFDEVGEEE